MNCLYPNCDCPISFPKGYKPSMATECPKGAVLTPREILSQFIADPDIVLIALGNAGYCIVKRNGYEIIKRDLSFNPFVY